MIYKKMYPLFFLLVFCLVPYMINGKQLPSPSKSNAEDSFTVKLYRHESNEIAQIPLKEYLCGVVAAEMQANYHPEALKAQAVAACTYTIYRYEYLQKNSGSDNGHPGAYVCDDYTHCKSYLEREAAKERWGNEWFDKFYPNIEAAVNQVCGQVITYENKVINAVFHAISSGTTEPAKNVWGSEIPYLVSVDSSVDTTAKGYETEVSFSIEEVKQKLKDRSINVTGEPTEWFSQPTLDSAGSVAYVTVCGHKMSGVEMRTIFGLRSTAFSIITTAENITFIVRGYGHQVGMSQNGANELAKQGKNYIDILQHYYSGVEIQHYNF